MDFQATLTKDAVIEYMTKYMTKSGQGSLIKVMEHSFSLGIEKHGSSSKALEHHLEQEQQHEKQQRTRIRISVWL